MFFARRACCFLLFCGVVGWSLPVWSAPGTLSTCQSHSDCSGGRFCRKGFCWQRCRKDSDCPNHSSCIKRFCHKRCLATRDCPRGLLCRERQCVAVIRRFRVKLGKVGAASYRLAIAPVRWFGPRGKFKAKKLTQDMRRQMQGNFRRLIGAFRVLRKKTFLEQAPHNGINPGEFRYEAWKNTGAHGLLKAGLKAADGGQVHLMLRFYDVGFRKLSLREDTTVPLSLVRWTIHSFCDRVYRYLTGTKGFFTSLIAYVRRNPKGGKDIWVMDFDGRNHRQVVRNGSLNLMPTWSPGGRYLVYTSYIRGRPDLYRLELATGRIRRLTRTSGTCTGAAFSPDGKKIAFAMSTNNEEADSDIYVINSNGGGLRKLTHDWGIDSTPTWSPDGKQIAFVSERYVNPQIFMMSANGSGHTRLTFRGDYNQEPRWNPKGKEILFTARDEYLQYDLFVIRLEKDETGKVKPTYRRLTQNQGRNFEATWSPDGRFILFVSTRYGERKLFIMNADGSKQRLFIRGRGDYETPAWSPPMSVSPFPSGKTGRYFYRMTRLSRHVPPRMKRFPQRSRRPPDRPASQRATSKSPQGKATTAKSPGGRAAPATSTPAGSRPTTKKTPPARRGVPPKAGGRPPLSSKKTTKRAAPRRRQPQTTKRAAPRGSSPVPRTRGRSPSPARSRQPTKRRERGVKKGAGPSPPPARKSAKRREP